MRLKRSLLAAAFSSADQGDFARHLAQAVEGRQGVLAGYAAMRDEIPVLSAMEPLFRRGWKLALPCVAGREKPLIFRLWAPGQALIVGLYGIGEPDPSNPECRPDVVLAPLLAFDARGFRLGYGGGHYDRTLATLGEGVAFLGAAYAGQEVDRLPADETDIPLHAVVTEREVRRFQAKRTGFNV